MSAVILEMPAKVQRTAKRRLDRVDLDARHGWVMGHRDKWDNEETDGREYRTPMEELMRPEVMRICGLKESTVAKMRKNIAEGRKQIEKRNQVKQWLTSQGATADDMSSAEHALFYLFDQTIAKA